MFQKKVMSYRAFCLLIISKKKKKAAVENEPFISSILSFFKKKNRLNSNRSSLLAMIGSDVPRQS